MADDYSGGDGGGGLAQSLPEVEPTQSLPDDEPTQSLPDDEPTQSLPDPDLVQADADRLQLQSVTDQWVQQAQAAPQLEAEPSPGSPRLLLRGKQAEAAIAQILPQSQPILFPGSLGEVSLAPGTIWDGNKLLVQATSGTVPQLQLQQIVPTAPFNVSTALNVLSRLPLPQLRHVQPQRPSLRERYAAISRTAWFRAAYEDRSLGKLIVHFCSYTSRIGVDRADDAHSDLLVRHLAAPYHGP